MALLADLRRPAQTDARGLVLQLESKDSALLIISASEPYYVTPHFLRDSVGMVEVIRAKMAVEAG